MKIKCIGMTDKRSNGSLFNRIHRRIPLSVKMLIITITVGLIVWVLLDQVQSRRLEHIFQKQLTERISAIVVPIFILTFALITFWITRRIKFLTQRISKFSHDVLGMSSEAQDFKKKGDQLYILEERFHRLTGEILQMREVLKMEAEEKLRLNKKQMEMEQKEKQLLLLQSVTDAVGVGVIKKTPEGLQVVNQQMAKILQKFRGISAFEVQDGDSLERTLIDADGNGHVFHISSPGIFKNKIILVRDITEAKKQTEALEYMALHDSLTDLPNRTLLYDRLEQAILAGKREDKNVALLVLDLDRFKEINDTVGHHLGDLVLKEVGKRILNTLRKSDTVARLGGDEFAVVLPTAGIEEAKNTAGKLLNVMEEPFLVSGNSFYLSTSIGIVLYPHHGEDAKCLLQRADVAMYDAKRHQNTFTVYNSNLALKSEYNSELVDELRGAIENGELVLYYQPKINYKNGHTAGLEALVRWHHPRRGLMYPDKFITLAEQTGLIKSLTRWVLNTAIRQCAEWHKKGIKIKISVNLSPKDFQDSQFPEHLAEMLGTWGVAPASLGLEIAESAVMSDSARTRDTLEKLDFLGVRLSVDDFGTGHSSFAYLKKLPIDEIKIDRSFIMNMAVDDNDSKIIHSTIELAHRFGLGVVAEGVESKEVLDTLGNFGCDKAQGYYISPPLSPDELKSSLRKPNYFGKLLNNRLSASFGPKK